MSEIIDRYVHQVGRYLPQRERREIQQELRSQIQDQLEDRFGTSPSPADVASVLVQFGEPSAIAKSYVGEQYLVGPNFYPSMMMVLRFGLPIIPGAMVLLNIIGALITGDAVSWIELLVESVLIALQGALFFVGAVVAIFALLERSGVEAELKRELPPFNPLELPPVDDPAQVDRAESSVGIALGAFFIIVLLYFLAIGGVSLRFNLSDPGEVFPVPVPWVFALLATTVGLLVLNLWALVRSRWTLVTWLTQTLLELVGAVGLYFVVWVPLFAWLSELLPHLRERFLFDRQPLIFLVLTLGITLISNASRLLKLWKHRSTP